MTDVRILLADDEHLIRGAMAMMLSLEDDFEVVAEAADGRAALALALEHHPDVVVLDLQMPEMDGLEVVSELRRVLPDCRCVIVTSHGHPGYLKRALSAGARAFVPKTSPRGTLPKVIREVMAGELYVDRDLAAEAIKAGDNPLTPREADVLEAGADGALVEEVARRVSLAAGTARNYLSSAMAKLGASNRHEAAMIARRHGWI